MLPRRCWPIIGKIANLREVCSFCPNTAADYRLPSVSSCPKGLLFSRSVSHETSTAGLRGRQAGCSSRPRFLVNYMKVRVANDAATLTFRPFVCYPQGCRWSGQMCGSSRKCPRVQWRLVHILPLLRNTIDFHTWNGK